MGTIYFDGRGCGCWDIHAISRAKALSLEAIPVGHQQAVIHFTSWGQVGEILKGTLYREIRIEARGSITS